MFDCTYINLRMKKKDDNAMCFRRKIETKYVKHVRILVVLLYCDCIRDVTEFYHSFYTHLLVAYCC